MKTPPRSGSEAFAPVNEHGPLPPGLTSATLARILDSQRLKINPALKRLGHLHPALEKDRVAYLRARLDDAKLRKERLPLAKGDDAAAHDLFYFYARKCSPALHAALFEPAEFARALRPGHSRVFLRSDAFLQRLAMSRDAYATDAQELPPESAGECLALMVLAYGLLQPKDAPAMVGALLGLGPGYARWFGENAPVATVSSPAPTTLVGPQKGRPNDEPHRPSVYDVQSPAAPATLFETFHSRLMAASEARRSLAGEARVLETLARELADVTTEAADELATRLLSATERSLELLTTVRVAWRMVEEARVSLAASVQAMRIDVPMLGPVTTSEERAAELRDWASRLQTRVGERRQERASLEERFRTAMESARIELGNDAGVLDQPASLAQRLLSEWELGEAQAAMTDLSAARAAAIERRARILTSYRRALEELWHLGEQAEALGHVPPKPIELADEARSDELDAATADLQRELHDLERSMASKAARREEAERARQLELERAEVRKATEPPRAATNAADSLPSLMSDTCVALLREGKQVDPLDAVAECDPQNLLKLLERFRALIDTARGDATRRVLEGIFDVASTQRLGWMWSSAVRQPNHQLGAAEIDGVWSLVRCLLDDEGAASEALELAIGLSSEGVPDSVREQFFLWYGARGIQARRQIPLIARRLEASGAPGIHATYAWIHALALVERATSMPKDEAVRAETHAYLERLPRDDRASRALHATLVRELEGERRRAGSAPRSVQSAAALATNCRKKLNQRRSLPDRWSNEHLRAEEDEFIASCAARLDELERKGITVTAIRALEPFQVSEKRLRKRLRRSGRTDPTGDGHRMARFVETLEDLASSVEDVQRARMLELSLASDSDPETELRKHLDELSGAQRIVAHALLDVDTPTTDAVAVSEPLPALSVLEDRLGRGATERERPWLRAYCTLRRGELAPLPGAPTGPEQLFVAKLRDHLQGKRERDIREIIELARTCAARATSIELSYPELGRIVAQLESPSRDEANLDELLAKVLEFEAKLDERQDELAESSRVLLEDFARHANADALFGRAHAEAKRLDAEHDHRAAVILLRTAAEALQSDDAQHARAARERLANLLPRQVVETIAEDVTWGERERRLSHALETRDRLRDAWLDTDAFDALVDEAKEAIATRDSAKLDEHFRALERALEDAPLVAEPPATHDRSLYQVTLPAGQPRVPARADYFPALTDDADEGKARAMLGLFATLAPGNVANRALEAEAARLSARDRAFRGDFEGARLACECMYFLIVRWGEGWERKEKFPAPLLPNDPLFAVSTLLACNIIARWVRAGAVGDPAGWLHKHPQQSVREPALRVALAGHNDTGFVHELLRLLAAASYMSPDQEADLALVRGLRGLAQIGREYGLIARMMNQFRNVDDSIRARWGLAKPLTIALHGEAEFSLQAFDQMFRLGRREEDIPASERETYRGLRLTMERYAHATGRRLRPAWEKLLSATARLEVEKSVRHLHVPAQAMRSVLAAMDFEVIPPHVRIALEEPFAVVDGSQATLTIAVKNEGDDPVRDLTLYSLPKSQFVLGNEQEPWRIDEPLEPQQEVIHRIVATIVDPGHPGPFTLDIQVECRGINDAPVALPPLSLTIRLRQEAQIPKVDRATLQQLFYETGIEVSEQGKNFFGRDEELAELQTRLLEKDPPDALLVKGMRRVGKTSLAKVFASTAEKTGHHAVFVDFKQFAGSGERDNNMAPARSFGFLATRLLELPFGSGKRIAATFGFEGFAWKTQVVELFKKAELPADLLRDLLVEVATKLPGEGAIVFIIDELDYLVDPWEREASRPHVYDLLNVLRGLIASQTGPLKRYRWVLCGSDRCKQMFESYDNPLYGSIAPMTIKGVQPEDCEAMLEGPFGRCNIDVTEDALAEVFELSQGFPFFINILGSRLCKVLATSPTDVISRWHVREAVALSMPANRQQEPPAPYDRLLEPIADRARTRGPVDEALLKLILGVIASRTSDAVPEVAFEAVMSLVEKHLGTRVSKKQVMDAAHVLEDFDWVRETRRDDEIVYQIRLPLLRRFVRDKYDYQVPVVAQRLIEAMGHGG